MLTYKLAGQAFLLKREELLPVAFRTSLETFSLESFSWETKTRAGNAPIEIEVTEAAPPNGEVFFHTGSLEVLHTEAGKLFRIPRETRCALSVCGNAWTLYLKSTEQPPRGNLLENLRTLIRVPFEEHTAAWGYLSLHACAFVYGGLAYCTTGKSGAGKSTLAGNFRKAVNSVHENAKLLNGDRPILCAEGGTYFAYGAPWSGKENIFVNASYPLGGIIEVKQCTVNRVYRLPPKKAANLLMKRVSLPLWNGEAAGETLTAISRAAERIPVYRMYCVNGVSAGDVLREALEHPEAVPELPKGEELVKIKNDFVMRKMLDEYIVVPVGSDSAAAQGAIMLNEVGAFLWEKLQTETTREVLLAQILAEFDVDEATAAADLDAFLETLRAANVLC